MRAFAQKLEAENELVRISEPVRTELEITALADREMKSPGGGRALLIEKPLLPGGAILSTSSSWCVGSWPWPSMSVSQASEVVRTV